MSVPDQTPAPRIAQFSFFSQAAYNEFVDIAPHGHSTLVPYIAAFESVQLISAVAQISIAACPDGKGSVAIGFISDDKSTTQTNIMASPFATHVYVNRDSSHNITLSLPTGHHFGKELKATILGNHPPKLAVYPRSITREEHQYKYSTRVRDGDSSKDVEKTADNNVVSAHLTITVSLHGAAYA